MEQKQPDKRKHGKWYVLAGGVLVMLVVCFVLGVIVGQRDGESETALVSASPGPPSTAIPSEIAEPTETVEPTMTPEPTWTATPTATPEPTETAEPTRTATLHPTLTATPAPTATAVPTATALSTLTVLGWAQEAGPQVHIIGDASQVIEDLLSKPLLGDATWTAMLAAQVAKLREVDAALRGMVPPEEVREAHAMLLAATSDYLLGTEYALEGVQQRDPELIEQAAEYMASGIAKMSLSRLMVEAMTP